MFLASSKYTNRLWYKTFFLFLLIVFSTFIRRTADSLQLNPLIPFFFDPFLILFFILFQIRHNTLYLRQFGNSCYFDDWTILLATACVRRGGLPDLTVP